LSKFQSKSTPDVHSDEISSAGMNRTHGEVSCMHKILDGKHKRNKALGNLDIAGRIIQNCIFKM